MMKCNHRQHIRDHLQSVNEFQHKPYMAFEVKVDISTTRRRLLALRLCNDGGDELIIMTTSTEKVCRYQRKTTHK
jgi:hypothetical protein